MPRSPCASGHWHSHRRPRFIQVIPRRRRRPILDILLLDILLLDILLLDILLLGILLLGIPLLGIPLLDILIRRPQPRRRAMPAMVILEPTPIIHTPTGVGLVGAIRGVGAGVGPGSQLAGVGAAGGVAADAGTADSAADSTAGLPLRASMAKALAVASMAEAEPDTVSPRG